jgi:trigger factor
MIVTRENVDAVNAILKVEVSPADYQNKVKAGLDKHRASMKMTGFRPGHVPMTIVQKKHGQKVLTEVLNKIVNDALFNFINENKIEILGNPIPSDKIAVEGNFNKPEDFKFTFEIGITPEINISLSDKNKYDYVKVNIDDALITKQIEDLRRRYGKLISMDKVGETDLILAQFVELKEDDSILEGGILHSSTISMDFVEDEKTKKDLLGKSIGDKVSIDPSKVSRGGKDTAAMLGIKEEELANISSKFQLTINEIKRMEMADLSQELFDRLFGEGKINNETELKEKIASDLVGMFVNDSDRLLARSIFEDLISTTNIELPDAFLKRWIRLSNDKPILPEQIEAEYDGYAKNLKWQLIQGIIFKANNLKLDNQEIIDFTKGLLISNFAQYGMPAPEDKELTETAIGLLSKKEESTQILEMIADQKITQYFKETVKLNEKEISYDDFMELASAKN